MPCSADIPRRKPVPFLWEIEEQWIWGRSEVRKNWEIGEEERRLS